VSEFQNQKPNFLPNNTNNKSPKVTVKRPRDGHQNNKMAAVSRARCAFPAGAE
jgi:hypothetical protein